MENSRKRKRTVVSRACTHCRNAHAKCSALHPCERCVSKGLECDLKDLQHLDYGLEGGIMVEANTLQNLSTTVKQQSQVIEQLTKALARLSNESKPTVVYKENPFVEAYGSSTPCSMWQLKQGHCLPQLELLSFNQAFTDSNLHLGQQYIEEVLKSIPFVQKFFHFVCLNPQVRHKLEETMKSVTSGERKSFYKDKVYNNVYVVKSGICYVKHEEVPYFDDRLVVNGIVYEKTFEIDRKPTLDEITYVLKRYFSIVGVLNNQEIRELEQMDNDLSMISQVPLSFISTPKCPFPESLNHTPVQDNCDSNEAPSLSSPRDLFFDFQF